jgi:hypothetical protein
MNKIINEFITTNKSIPEILKTIGFENQPIEVALLIITRQMYFIQLPKSDYEKIDYALEIGHPDDEVFFLFISYLLAYYCIQGMDEKAEGVFRISNSFNLNKYQPEILVQYYQFCAFYHITNTKNFNQANEYLFVAISKMSKSSPRYDIFIINLGQTLSFQGRLYELPKEELEVIIKHANKTYVAASDLFKNAVFTRNIDIVEKCY